MSASSIVHILLLISFAAVVGWLWRDYQLDRDAALRASPSQAVSLDSQP